MGIIIAQDLGTSTISAIAVSNNNRQQLATLNLANDAEVAGLPINHHEQNPMRILGICKEAICSLLADTSVIASEVEGIAISGQMHGVMLVDHALEPLTNLITWRDGRTLSSAQPGNLESALEILDEDRLQRTGCDLHSGYGGASLYWLVKNKQLPGNCIALSLADFIAASLTGVIATEQTHAASWGILNLESKDWDTGTLEQLGIPRSILPTVHSSSLPLAPLLHDVAATLGLPEDVQVCSPIGDNQASFIGAAGLSREALVFNLGTGGQVSVPQKTITVLPGMENRPMPFEGSLLVGASLCGGWSYAYLCQFYQNIVREIAGVEISEQDIYKKMNALAKSAQDETNRLLVDTRFSGTRVDHSISGAITGIDTTNLSPGNLALGFIEGMVGELADMSKSVDMSGIKEIIGGGNAVRKNPLVPDIVEKKLGLPCRISKIVEEAAIGAALAAVQGLALVSKSEEAE